MTAANLLGDTINNECMNIPCISVTSPIVVRLMDDLAHPRVADQMINGGG
eukprot:CAMPEP_0206135754 /NCGR_PEP_ID=MMETSP1473-20131121/1026_1 /ASSEMBLY_ACC=CAM_ASM_001109 /TAXON_ID=1461547 /ORGANISM="Stichococcus sp, Strain RCC1054" /LENGTH=49 /DNA_ID= /DNA_START= /DNA_END= /DNA_ORIENTATION=